MGNEPLQVALFVVCADFRFSNRHARNALFPRVSGYCDDVTIYLQLRYIFLFNIHSWKNIVTYRHKPCKALSRNGLSRDDYLLQAVTNPHRTSLSVVCLANTFPVLLPKYSCRPVLTMSFVFCVASRVKRLRVSTLRCPASCDQLANAS